MKEVQDAKMLLSDLTLLYVEDEETLRKHNSHFFQKLFKEVYIAQNGHQGVELFQKHLPDIIVTDINMPVMNGIIMAKTIKNVDDTIPIIVLTAYNDESLLLELIDIGVDAFLNKPIDFKKSLAALSKIARNIKAKKELAEKNTLLIQQARNAAMGEILSQVAHHWRQPLTIFSLGIQKLPMVYKKGELDAEFLNTMVKESIDTIRSMSKTIDIFTSFSKQASENTIFSLKEAIDEALSLILPQLKADNITVETEIDEHIKMLSPRADFQQSLLKILSNAHDAIISHQIKEGKVVIHAKTLGNYTLELKISDNGGGIKEDALEKLFDPYYTTKGLASGTGLGLYIVKMIVEDLMQGKITAENNTEGATITMMLPHTKEQPL